MHHFLDWCKTCSNLFQFKLAKSLFGLNQESESHCCHVILFKALICVRMFDAKTKQKKRTRRNVIFVHHILRIMYLENFCKVLQQETVTFDHGFVLQSTYYNSCICVKHHQDNARIGRTQRWVLISSCSNFNFSCCCRFYTDCRTLQLSIQHFNFAAQKPVIWTRFATTIMHCILILEHITCNGRHNLEHQTYCKIHRSANLPASLFL